jgi:retron-type reverse transcriptase
MKISKNNSNYKSLTHSNYTPLGQNQILSPLMVNNQIQNNATSAPLSPINSMATTVSI